MKRTTLEFLQKRKSTILRDLTFKTEVEDWHGVQDCASDLREIEAQIEILKAPTSDEQEAERRAVAPTL